jgi:SAM-dependent methyltransferase
MRTRGLSDMDARFAALTGHPQPILEAVTRALTGTDPVRVLEIGFGQGRAMLELAARCSSDRLEIHGVSAASTKPKHKVFSRADLATNACELGLSVPAARLPHVDFYDAGEGLRFESQSLDVVMSQVAFHFVADKARLLEETWRVLKPGGAAFLHIDTALGPAGQPDFMRGSATPRFIIYRGEHLISLADHCRVVLPRDCDLRLGIDPHRSTQLSAIMRRTSERNLRLGLELDRASTFDLSANRRDEWKKSPSGWWGSRSVYRASGGGDRELC